MDPDLGAFWSAAIAAAVAALISAGELYDHIPRSRLNLLVRWQSLVYILLNIVFAVAALLLLRYVTIPNSRPAELEQIALAGVGARFALTRAIGAKSGRRKKSDGNPASPSLFDNVMNRIITDLQGGENRRVTHLLASLTSLTYDHVNQVCVPILTGQIIEKLNQDRKDEFNRNLRELDQRSVLDPDGARDTLLLLVISYAGEDWLRDVLVVYAARFPQEKIHVTAAIARLDVPPTWWNLRRQVKHRRHRKALAVVTRDVVDGAPA